MSLLPVRRIALSLAVLAGFGIASQGAYADTFYSTAAGFAAATSGVTTQGFGTSTPGPGGQLYDTAASSYGSVTLSATSAGTNIHVNDPSYYNVNGAYPAYPDGNYMITFGGGSSDTILIGIPSSTAFSINVGGTFATGGNETVTITLSDGYSITLPASSFATSGNSLEFFGFTTITAITSATLTVNENSSTGLYGTFDTVQYGAALASTPEPSSIALLGTGVLSAAGMIRRRNKA